MGWTKNYNPQSNSRGFVCNGESGKKNLYWMNDDAGVRVSLIRFVSLSSRILLGYIIALVSALMTPSSILSGRFILC